MGRRNRGKTVNTLLESVRKNGVSCWAKKSLPVSCEQFISRACREGFHAEVSETHVILLSARELTLHISGKLILCLRPDDQGAAHGLRVA